MLVYVCVRGRVCSHPLQVAAQDPLAPSYTPHPAAEHWCYCELTHTSAQAGSHLPRVPFLLEKTIKHIWNYNMKHLHFNSDILINFTLENAVEVIFFAQCRTDSCWIICAPCVLCECTTRNMCWTETQPYRLECSQYNTVRLGICWQSFTVYSTTTQDFTLDVHCGHGLNYCETLDF